MKAALAATLMLGFAAQAAALEVLPFDATAFALAQKEGRALAIQFHSGWCPVCVLQARGVDALKSEKSFERLTVFQADFFKEEALRKRYNVNSFSTLVVFHGEQERGRTTGDFRPEQLRPLLAKTL